MAKWTPSKLEKLRTNVINGDDDEEEVVKGDWTPAKLEKLRGGIIEDMNSRNIPTTIYTPEYEQSMQELANLESTTGMSSASSDAPMITPEESYAYSMQQLERLNDNQKSTLGKWADDLSAYLTQTQTNAQNKNPFGDFVGSDSSVKLAERAQQEKQALIDSGMPDVSHDNVDNMRQWREYQEYVNDYEDRQKQQEELKDKGLGELLLDEAFNATMMPYRSFSALAGALDRPLDREHLGINTNSDSFFLQNLNEDVTNERRNKLNEYLEGVNMPIGSISLGNLNHNQFGDLVGGVEKPKQATDIKSGDVVNNVVDAAKMGAENVIGSSVGTGVAEALGLAGKVGNAVATAISVSPYFGEGYSQEIKEAQDRGLTEDEAEKLAFVSGSLEAVTEILPDYIRNKTFGSIGKKLGKEFVEEGAESIAKYLAKQTGSEMSEELINDVAYTLADNIITGDKSVYNTNKKKYMDEGMSEEDATKQARIDWAKDTAKDMAVAGLSSLLTGGGTAVVNSYASNMASKALEGNYREVAQAIPDNVEDYNSEEDYNKAMEVKARAEELDTQDKVSSADRSGLLQDIYAVNETMPNVDLIENINESVNSPFADVGGFQVAKNDITSQQVAQSMAQASQSNNVNDFVEAYRDSQASSNAEARQTGQKYFDTLSPKFYTYDEGSRLLDNALSENTADELYTMALNGEEVAPELLNTQRKADYYNQGAERRNDLIEIQNQLQEQRKAQELAEKESIGQTKIKKVETPQGKAKIADISINNDGSFVWKKGEEEVVIPKKDISDRAMQQYMEYATSQPTLRAKQLYADNYVGSVPINSYNMAFNAAVNAGRTNYNFNSWLKSKPYFKAVGVEALQKFYDYGAEEAKGYNKTVKARKAVKSEDKFGGIKTSDKGKLYIDGEVSDKIKDTGIYEIAKQFQKAHKTSVGVDYGTLIEKNQVAKVDDNGNIVRDANGNVETEEKDLLFNGEFRSDLNQILLGVNGKEYQTLSHEGIGEKILAYTAQEASELYDAMAIYLQDTMGADAFNDAIQGYIDRYNKAGKKTDFSYALYEYINDSLVGIFSTEKGQRDFVENLTKNEDKSLIDKFKELFNRLLNKVHQLVEDMKKNNQYTEGALKLMEAGEEQLQEWRDEVFRLLGLADERAEGTSNEESMAASLDIDSLESKKEFSLTEPIEKKGSLIAVHNRTAQDMLYAIEQGGIAMPSIAVTKTDMLHTNFGDVSVLYPSKVIDPQYADNYVYSGDAYTPITPRVEYKTNEDMVRDFGREVKEITKKLPGLYNSVSFYEVNYQDRLNSTGSMYEVFKNNPAVIYAYLKEKNIPIRTPYKDNVYDETKEMAARLLRHYTLEELKSMSEGLSKEKNLEVLNVLNQDRLNEYLKDHTQEEYDELPLFEKNMISMYDEKYHPSVRTENEIKDVVKYKTNGAKKVVDYDTLNKRLRKKINKSNEEDYKQWLSSKLDKAVIKKQYRNNKDYYTRSGNPRSWNQLHDDYTLDNAIRIMREGAEKGEGQFGYNIFGSSTVNYNSIDEIHADEDRLQERDYEEYKQLRSDINDELYRIANHIKPSSSWDVSSAAKDIAEAVATRKTKQGIKNWLSEWYNVENSDIDDIMNLVQEVREMPTTYFEAKPQRAVTLDEIAKVVVPSDATELITALEENNIPYNTYERDNEDSRREAVNSAVEEKDVRFSLDVPTTHALSIYDENIDLDSVFVGEESKDAISYESKISFEDILRSANKSLGFKISRDSVNEIADKVIKDYTSDIDKEMVVKNLGIIFSIMEDEQGNYDDMGNALLNLSQEIVDRSKAVDPDEVELFDKIKDVLKRNKFRLSDNQLSEVNNIKGWNNYFGGMSFAIEKSDSDAPYLDNVYGEIARELREIGVKIDENATPVDQPLVLKDLINEYKPVIKKNDFEGADPLDIALVLTNEIMEEYYKQGALDNAGRSETFDAVRAKLRKNVNNYKKKVGEVFQNQVKELQERLNEEEKANKLLRGLLTEQFTNAQKGEEYYEELKGVKAENKRQAGEIDRKERVIQNVQERAKIKALRSRDSLVAYKAKQEKAHQLDMIRKTGNRLYTMIKKPTKTRFVPDLLQRPVLEMLDSIDFLNYKDVNNLTGNQSVFVNGLMQGKSLEEAYKIAYPNATKKLKEKAEKLLDNPKVKKAYEELTGTSPFEKTLAYPNSQNAAIWKAKMGEISRYLKNLQDPKKIREYGRTFAQRNALNNLAEQCGTIVNDLLDEFINSTANDDVVISKLDTSQLKKLNDFMTALTYAINNANKLFTVGGYSTIDMFGMEALKEMYGLKAIKSTKGLAGWFNNFFNINMVTPVTFFENLGKTTKKLFTPFVKADDSRWLRVKEATDDFAKEAKRLKVDKAIREWEKELHTYEFGEGTLKLTIPQIMYLYAINKRELTLLRDTHGENGYHIPVGGVVADEIDVNFKNKKDYVRQIKSVHLTQEEVERITDTLSEKQKELADYMATYLAKECGEWGNNVTRQMWGLEKYNEEYYMPYITDKNVTETNVGNAFEEATLRSLQNSSFTKELTPNANTPIILSNIFDVFSNHIEKMATYEAFVLPINDALRFLNFNNVQDEEGNIIKISGKRYDNSIKMALDRVLGKQGEDYYKRFIADINGDKTMSSNLKGIDKLLSYNKAQAVMANLRVVALQPTAYPKALEVIEGKYLLKALKMSPATWKKYIKKSQEKVGLAWLKANGYYETNIGASVKKMITGISSLREKVNEYAGFLAGALDNITWGALYRACEIKVAEETKGGEISEKDFDKRVKDIYLEIIVKTQVVDATITKSQLMRSKDTGTKLLTTFAGEPSTYYNMLHRGAWEFYQTKSKKKLAKNCAIIAFTGLIMSAVTMFADAWRDNEDDKKTLSDKLLDALVSKSKFEEAKTPLDYADALLSSDLFDSVNPLNWLPGFKEIISAIEGYDQQNMSTAAIYTVIDYVKTMEKVVSGESKLEPYGIINKGAKAFSVATGIPLATATREIKDMYNNINDFWGGENLVSRKSNTNPVVEAIQNNEDITETAKQLKQEKIDEKVAEGKTQKEAESAAKSGISQSITTKYRDQLIELHSTDINEANALKQRLIEAYVAIGYTREDANKKINDWFK